MFRIYKGLWRRNKSSKQSCKIGIMKIVRYLVELQSTRQNINNMEKHIKDLENIKVKKDFLQATLKETNANYQNLKAKKDTLNVEHNKLQKDYKNMEQIFLKQQKELEELRVDNGNVHQTKNHIQRQSDKKHAQMDKILQKQMDFNEKLQKLLKEAQKVKPFNYDIVLKKNNEFKKQHTLLQVKLKALLMEEKDVDL